MDPSRNRPSRPRLRSANSARVLVFDQPESEVGSKKMNVIDLSKKLPPKMESKEAPVRQGLLFAKSLSKKFVFKDQK